MFPIPFSLTFSTLPSKCFLADPLWRGCGGKRARIGTNTPASITAFLFKVTFLDFLAFKQVGKRAAEREEKKGEGGEYRKQALGHLYEGTTTSWGMTLSAWPSAPLGVWLLSSLRMSYQIKELNIKWAAAVKYIFLPHKFFPHQLPLVAQQVDQPIWHLPEMPNYQPMPVSITALIFFFYLQSPVFALYRVWCTTFFTQLLSLSCISLITFWKIIEALKAVDSSVCCSLVFWLHVATKVNLNNYFALLIPENGKGSASLPLSWPPGQKYQKCL